LNPRRPSPADLKSLAHCPSSRFYGNDFHSVGAETLSFISGNLYDVLEFLKSRYLVISECEAFVRKRARDFYKDYVRAIKRPLHSSKVSIVSHRHFINYLYYVKGLDYRYLLERLELQIPKSGVDRRVPSIDEVLETLKILKKERPHGIFIVYRVLLETGLRLEHTVELLKLINELHIVKLGGYYRVDLNIVRGEKKALHAYLIEIPPKILIAPNTVSNYVSKRKLLNPKYIRKFVITMMHLCDIDDSIVKFITGHLSEADIYDTRYYQRLLKADKQYKQYAEWLKQNILKQV